MNAAGGQRGGPGSATGVGLVGGRVALLLGGDVSSTLVNRLKDAVFHPDPVEAVFNVLTEAGIRNLPSFACVIREDQGIRLLMRGSVAAIVRTFAGEERTIRGEQVSTWAEHVIRAPREVTLRSGTATVDTGMLVLLFEEKDTRKAAKRKAPARPAATPEPTAWDPEPVLPAPRPQPAAPHPAPPPLRPATPQPKSAPAPRSAPPLPPPAPRPQPLRPAAASSPPGKRPGDITISPDDQVSPPPWSDADGEFDFSHLLDQTVHHGVEAAAVREPDADDPFDSTWGGVIEGAPSRPPTEDSMGDHEGDTVAHPRRPPASAPRAPVDRRQRPAVQAVQCGRGHANPPTADRCATCGDHITDRTIFDIERPVLGQLHFSDGLVVELDRPLLLGRKPDHVPLGEINGEEPGVVALPDPDKALSRQHVEIRLEEWHVMVVDRQSANGTYVELPGEEVMQLHPGQPCLITPGTRVTLADVLSFVFDAAPG